MPIYDEYQIVINEGQRRVIMRALTNAMANDLLATSKRGTLSRPTPDEYMQLIRLFSTMEPSVRKRPMRRIANDYDRLAKLAEEQLLDQERRATGGKT